jgi:hypothetical protein
MEREYITTTDKHTALWWTLGALAVLLILWFAFFHGRNNAGIPNTGSDDTANTAYTSDTLDNSAAPADSGSPAVIDESKG